VQEILLLHLQVKEIQEEVAFQLVVVHLQTNLLVTLLVEAAVALVEAVEADKVFKVETVEQVLNGQAVLETTMLVVELDMEYLEHQALEDSVVVETQTQMEQQILVAVAVLVESQEKQAVLV
jgi:hypothetical protein